jgi:ABC-2 type transport system ATP-binding protein
MNAITIKGLKKLYGGKTIIDRMNLSVGKGEFFGFLGPNGAGKTTTIHCMTGIARYEEGVISLFDTDVTEEYHEARKKVGLAPQEFNVDIFVKVWKLLDYVGGYYGLSKKVRSERVEELLDQFGLTEHKEKAFRELSGGLKRRALLARAMVHDPPLLILDEPTAGVDVELRHELWEMLARLNKAGKTIFLTSHYLEEVELLCSRIAIIHKGTIAVVGNKSEFVNNGKRLEEKYLEITKGEHY